MGVLHLASSVVAMLLGAYMLWANKGTQRHKKVGYAYCLSMLSVNITALGIYHQAIHNHHNTQNQLPPLTCKCQKKEGGV